MNGKALSYGLGLVFFIGIVIALIVYNVNSKKNSEPYIAWGKSYGAPDNTSPYAGFLAPYFRPFTEGGYGACYMTQPKPGQAIPDCPYGFQPERAQSPYRGYWYCCAR